MDKPVKPLIFLHIPKTAGLTMHEILNDQYIGRRQKIMYSVDFMPKYINLSDEKKRKVDVIKGHLLFGLHESMPMQATYITMLRNPLDRTLSGYDFIKQYKPHPFHKQMVKENYSLYDFLNQKLIRNFDNNHVRHLAAVTSLPFGEVTMEHFETAKKNLSDNKMFFGITEYFDESILYFKHELGWTTPWYEKKNVNAKKTVSKSTLDDKTREIIKQCNVYDDMLYDFALAEFKKRIAALGIEFENEVKEFKAKNPQISTAKKVKNYFRGKYLTFIQSRFF